MRLIKFEMLQGEDPSHHSDELLLRMLGLRVYESEVPEGSSSPLHSRAEPDRSSADVHWTTQTSVCSVCCGTWHTGGPTQPPRSGQLVADTHCLIVNGPWFIVKILFNLLFSPRPGPTRKTALVNELLHGKCKGCRCRQHLVGGWGRLITWCCSEALSQRGSVWVCWRLP